MNTTRKKLHTRCLTLNRAVVLCLLGCWGGVGLAADGSFDNLSVSQVLTVDGGIDNNNSGITDTGSISGATTISASGSISTTGTISGAGLTSSGGITNSGGAFDNNGQGINNAGAISGATTISASGLISGVGIASTNGLSNNGSVFNNNSQGINNAGAISGATTISASGLISTTGAISGVGIASTSGLSNTGGVFNNNNQNITNAGSISGVTTINSTGLITSGAGFNTGSISISGSTNNISGVSTLDAGTINSTTIHNTGLTTSDGGFTTDSIHISDGASGINNISGVSTLDAGTINSTTINNTGALNQTGITNINTSGSAATSIGSGTNTGNIIIGNAGNSTSLNSATNNIGTSGTYSTTNNIGTNNANSSTNTIGNNNTATRVDVYAGNSSLSMANNSANLSIVGGGSFAATNLQAQLAYGPNTLRLNATQLNGAVGGGSFNVTDTTTSIGNAGGGSYTSTSTSNVVGSSGDPLINGDAASQANVLGASYVNRIQGNTLVDGNMYINGTLAYASSSSATTTVTSGDSVLPDAHQQTMGQMAIVNKGEPGVAVDRNGKITRGSSPQSTASMTMTNGVGNVHGVVITETQTTVSGGTYSTSMTLDDGGARFSNAATGAPVRVTGVADGRTDFDAVNYRQLKHTEKRLSAGVAGTSAMANIPQVDPNKNFSLGIGIGNFQDQTAVALGAAFRPSRNTVFKVSASTVNGMDKSTAFGAGIGFSW